jgi:hypothetical protein
MLTISNCKKRFPVLTDNFEIILSQVPLNKVNNINMV